MGRKAASVSRCGCSCCRPLRGAMGSCHCASGREDSNRPPAACICASESAVTVGVPLRRRVQALSAASADEAIGILESRSDGRLVFTDVNMPGSMNGLRLAHAVRGRWPPVELLVTAALGNITTKDLPERGRFLAKPYDADTLSEAFQQMAGV